jgi:homoserine dehydrogenase
VATITPTSKTAAKVTVGLRQVLKGSALGSVDGTDSLVAFSTKRYAASPLVVQGAGAGTAVTAAGVVTDLLELARGG